MRGDFDEGYGIHQGAFYPKSFGMVKHKVGYEKR